MPHGDRFFPPWEVPTSARTVKEPPYDSWKATSLPSTPRLRHPFRTGARAVSTWRPTKVHRLYHQLIPKMTPFDEGVAGARPSAVVTPEMGCNQPLLWHAATAFSGSPAFHPAIDGRLVYGESPGRLRHVTTGLEEGLADDRVLSPSEALPERAFRPRTRAATDMRGEVFGTNLTARRGDGPPGAQVLQLSD